MSRLWQRYWLSAPDRAELRAAREAKRDRQQTGRAAVTYRSEVRAPLPCLVFVLPFVVAYEAAAAWLPRDQWYAVRNGAESWLQSVIQLGGVSHPAVLPGLVVLTLLGRQIFGHFPWRLRWRTLAGMAAESLAFAILLIGVGQLQQALFARSVSVHSAVTVPGSDKEDPNFGRAKLRLSRPAGILLDSAAASPSRRFPVFCPSRERLHSAEIRGPNLQTPPRSIPEHDAACIFDPSDSRRLRTAANVAKVAKVANVAEAAGPNLPGQNPHNAPPNIVGNAVMPRCAVVSETAALTWHAGIVAYVGAGLYEEVLFRLWLLPIVYFLLRGLGCRAKPAWCVAILLTSVLFAAAHHWGPNGEDFAAFPFAFRAVAGIVFGVLYVTRGFGITVGAHAGYDVIVGAALGG